MHQGDPERAAGRAGPMTTADLVERVALDCRIATEASDVAATLVRGNAEGSITNRDLRLSDRHFNWYVGDFRPNVSVPGVAEHLTSDSQALIGIEGRTQDLKERCVVGDSELDGFVASDERMRDVVCALGNLHDFSSVVQIRKSPAYAKLIGGEKVGVLV
jgi:hypothetical protein